MSEYQNLLILSHLSESIDVPVGWCLKLLPAVFTWGPSGSHQSTHCWQAYGTRILLEYFLVDSIFYIHFQGFFWACSAIFKYNEFSKLMLKSKYFEFCEGIYKFSSLNNPKFLKGQKCFRFLRVHYSNYISAFTRYLNTVHDADIAPQQVWYCSYLTYGVHTTVYVSYLLILNMTFERFYSITMPHKAASFNTVKRAKITIICIVVFSVVFHIPHCSSLVTLVDSA